MRNGRRGAAALAVTALALIGPAGAQAAESFYGVTASNRLVTFNSDTPGAIRSGVPITGLADSDTGIQGIDVRPADGALYGVGSAGILYRIDPATGVSTQIGLGFGLSGRSFGVDFNPVADRLRVVSDSGQNLRVNPITGGATTDRALAYAAGDRNAGKAPSVVGAAYTNSTAGRPPRSCSGSTPRATRWCCSRRPTTACCTRAGRSASMPWRPRASTSPPATTEPGPPSSARARPTWACTC